MRWLFALVLAAGCAPMALTPVIIREPRPEPLPLTIGVHYPDELRSYRKVRTTLNGKPLRGHWPGAGDFNIGIGQASVKLFDEVLGLLFARIVSVPSLPPLRSGEESLPAVIEPRIGSAILELQMLPPDRTFARATISYTLTLYPIGGAPLVTWTVYGTGVASSTVQLSDAATWNVEQRSFELALRDAAWNFTSSFRDVQGVRRWLDERGVR